jgi:hypothetical protein
MVAAVVLLALSAAPVLSAPPPARPLPLTPLQFQAMREIENQPQNAAVRQVHATYQSEHQREMERIEFINDATSAATFAGMIGAIAAILCIGVF